MQRLVIDVEDRYINLVTELLSNLKQNIIKNIVVEKKEQTKDKLSKLEQFRELKAKSKNKKTLTMAMATNTDEMVNDGLL
jgi:hypothetical protein